MAKHTPAFWLNTADWKTVAVVKDLNEMADALKKAPVEVVQHHLKNGKNDFAEWAEKGLGLKTLAERLRKVKAKTPKQVMEKVISAFEKAKK